MRRRNWEELSKQTHELHPGAQGENFSTAAWLSLAKEFSRRNRVTAVMVSVLQVDIPYPWATDRVEQQNPQDAVTETLKKHRNGRDCASKTLYRCKRTSVLLM